MTCEHEITVIDGVFKICTECGLLLKNVVNTLETSRNHPWGEPIGNKVYSHKSRFRKLLNRLLMTSSPPPEKMYVYLETKQISNIQNIRRHLKNYPHSSKYYEFISFFSHHFLKHRWRPVAPEDIDRIFRFVDEISFWGKSLGRNHFPFPYFYVLRKIFQDRKNILCLVSK